MSRVVVVPALCTARLRLRGWTQADRLEWPHVVGEPEIMRFLLPHRPLTLDEAQAQFDRLRGAWELHGLGHWAVEEAVSGRLLGRLGLERHPDWERNSDAVELGWILRRDAWGMGYATEGGHAALRFAFVELSLDEVISISDPRNRASLRVMEKLGFEPRGVEHWRHQNVVWYGLTAGRWRHSVGA